MSFDHDVCVVGGAGHVGLPLGLVLADAGFRVALFDHNIAALEGVICGKMPFVEDGAEEILDRVVDRLRTLTCSPADAHLAMSYAVERARVIIVCVGTPVDEYAQPRPDKVVELVRGMSQHLKPGQHVMLRSTLFPGTMRRLREVVPEGVGLSYCPERIVQGRAVKELSELPQIVSGDIDVPTELFQRIGAVVIPCSPEEAELGKLFLNSWRYIQFAAANQFMQVADSLGVDYRKVESAMKAGYARAAGLPGPGFAAGPCLLKDTMQLAAAFPQGFSFGHAARLVNEGLPEFIADKVCGIDCGTTIGILGMSFKADIDDHRDSLSFKLRRLLEHRGRVVVCSDEHMRRDMFVSKETLVERCSTIVVGVPHEAYRGLSLEGRKVVDLWGVTENGEYL